MHFSNLQSGWESTVTYANMRSHCDRYQDRVFVWAAVMPAQDTNASKTGHYDVIPHPSLFTVGITFSTILNLIFSWRGLQDHDTMQSFRLLLTFRRNILPPTSEYVPPFFTLWSSGLWHHNLAGGYRRFGRIYCLQLQSMFLRSLLYGLLGYDIIILQVVTDVSEEFTASNFRVRSSETLVPWRHDSQDHNLNLLIQWFPNGVSRYPGVSGGTTRCVAKLKKKI
jgi:hypothetical protein